MAQQVVNGTEVNGFDLVQVTALVALLLNAEVHLYQDTFAPSPDSTHADFTAAIATFNGYANAVVTWSAPGLGADGDYATISSRAFFQATDGLVPNSIGGAWLETTGAQVIDFFPFPAPISMSVAGAFIAVTVLAKSRPGTLALVEN